MNFKNYFTSSMIAKLAIFSALSFVLYMFPKLQLPFFPFFLELNFSDIPALICGFVLGPLAAVIVIVVKILLKLPFTGTVGVGELADLIIGMTFAVVPALIYKRHKTIKFALIGLIIGGIASTAIAILSNIYIIVPVYVLAFYEGDINNLINTCKPFAPSMTKENFFFQYSLFIILPFNLLRCTVAGILTFLLYKRTSKLFHRF